MHYCIKSSISFVVITQVLVVVGLLSKVLDDIFHCIHWASYIIGNGEYWNGNQGIRKQGEVKSLKRRTSQWHFLLQWRLHQWKGLPFYNPHTKVLGSLSLQISPNQSFIRALISLAVWILQRSQKFCSGQLFPFFGTFLGLLASWFVVFSLVRLFRAEMVSISVLGTFTLGMR